MQDSLALKILLSLILLISCVVIPISYARYKEGSFVSGNIDIARWEIIINDSNIDESHTFNLFDTVNSNDIKEGLKVIAPGVFGNIDLSIENSSDVTAQYTINIEETKNDDHIPILYSFEKDGEYKKINELPVIFDKVIDINNQDNITLYWKWAYFESNIQNEKDNELGLNGTAIVQVNITVVVNQKVN